MTIYAQLEIKLSEGVWSCLCSILQPFDIVFSPISVRFDDLTGCTDHWWYRKNSGYYRIMALHTDDVDVLVSKRSSGVPFGIFPADRKTQIFLNFCCLTTWSLIFTGRLCSLVLTVYFVSFSNGSHWDSAMPSAILTKFNLASIPEAKIQRCRHMVKIACQTEIGVPTHIHHFENIRHQI